MEPRHEIEQLQERLGVEWPSINLARSRTAEVLARLGGGLTQTTSDDGSLVVFGSLARGEYTKDSDVDWTLLIDGQTYPEQPEAAADVSKWLEENNFTEPGREGTFGGLAFSHDLVRNIGGQEDTNRNLTRRMLLLLESAPVGRADAYARVVNAALERYIYEDFGWIHSTDTSYVPRFLLNDVVRYWRTVAVDFAYKRFARAGEGWALRTIKLRLSRKLTYAAGLVACYRCSFLKETYPDLDELPMEDRAGLVVADLAAFLRKTPLDRLAWVFMRFQELAPHAESLFGSYDRFLALLNSDVRERLEDLQREAVAGDADFRQARELGHRFQNALNEIFLPASRGVFYELTRAYGVF